MLCLAQVKMCVCLFAGAHLEPDHHWKDFYNDVQRYDLVCALTLEFYMEMLSAVKC